MLPSNTVGKQVKRLLTLNYYRPQRSWGKIIFSQASVILLTGGVLLLGVLLGRGLLGEVSAPGGGAWWIPPPGTATAAGGTHPTGMHSCILLIILGPPVEHIQEVAEALKRIGDELDNDHDLQR